MEHQWKYYPSAEQLLHYLPRKQFELLLVLAHCVVVLEQESMEMRDLPVAVVLVAFRENWMCIHLRVV